jgi:hypothetical protein
MLANYQTLEKLIKRIIQRLSMYQGISVQVYAEDRIAQMILDNYNLVVDSFAWSSLSFWKEFTLAGSNGEVLEKVSDYITTFSDIISIVDASDPTYALNRLHNTTPPSEVSGTIPAYFRIHPTDKDKVFQVVPFEAVGKVLVNAKGKLNTNQTIIPDTIIPFDSDYLVYAVCCDYLADDDNSQTQLQKFVQIRDGRLAHLKDIDNAGTIDYNDEVSQAVLTKWR